MNNKRTKNLKGLESRQAVITLEQIVLAEEQKSDYRGLKSGYKIGKGCHESKPLLFFSESMDKENMGLSLY